MKTPPIYHIMTSHEVVLICEKMGKSIFSQCELRRQCFDVVQTSLSVKAHRLLVSQTLFKSLVLTRQLLIHIANRTSLCRCEYRIRRRTKSRSVFSHQSPCGSFVSSRFRTFDASKEEQEPKWKMEVACKINKSGRHRIFKRPGPALL